MLNLELQRITLGDQVYEAMRRWILDGTLAPGTPLRIRQLAASLGTSTMPVREAIQRLEENGLVVTRPHKGAVVAGLSVRELRDFYGVRIVLE
ncbi:MAG: GntR family transcriptional regulator, partial [bacterium]|nr:GntR family transcriptional regulator [bacterium]